jgi:ankyrin repeat protein
MKIPCSNCNQRLEIPEELAGQTIECPACKASLTVPSLQPPPVTPQVQVTTPQAAAPQAAAPQKTAPQRKTSTALKAASSKKSKLPIPKWAIAAVGGVTVMALVMYFLSGPSVDIWEAVATGNIEVVKQHLADGAPWPIAPAEEGWTPLHLSVQNGKKEVSELLISEGADVNAMNMWGGTPLQLAAREGRKEIAELLIENEADLNVKDKSGLTSLDWAIYYHHPETTDLLRKHGGKTGDELKAADKPTAPVAEAAQPEPPTAEAPDISIHKAAKEGNIEAVKQHIAAGTDVNEKDDFFGRTPLYDSAMRGQKEVAELLIANGADVKVKDIDGWTPLRKAAYYGHKEIVELLIANGADVNAMINKGAMGGMYDGRTPLDEAAGEIADLLRKHGGKTGEELKAEGN